ncbi:MAG: NAD(P)-dependent oxidoreductase [Gammaproteobacteria bacterium]|nr:NAD(P)-dependent oxidoreductase [Gammaproteobacteria bacterium]
MRTGVIGLGAMGAPMARNLHLAGYLETVWNRTCATADQLAGELGAAAAADPAALASCCELVVLSVSADADVLEMVQALLPGVKAGTVVLDTSTVSRETAVHAADLLQAVGAVFLDAPVSGGIEGARNGTLAMMIGGDAASIERVTPVLNALAGRVEHMGPVGAGQATKAVNQLMAAGINQAVTEALAFANALELPLGKVIEVTGSGAAGNWFLDHRGPTMTQGKYDPGFRVALHHKDLAICKHMAEQFDVALPVVEMTLIHYRRLMAAGYGDEDISALFREKLGLFDKTGERPGRP